MLRSLLINTGSNVTVLFIKLALTLVMTPIFVKYLGKYDYGLWEVIVGILGYMGMLDMGMKPTISRYVAKYNAEDDRPNLNKVYASTFVFTALVGAGVALIFIVWGTFFAQSMAPDGESASRYQFFLYILAAQLVIVFPGYVAESYLEGFQKYYLKNNVTIVNSLVGAGVFITLATPDNALLLLAGVNATGLITKYIFYGYLVSRPDYCGTSLKLSLFSWETLREMLSFGVKSFVQGVSNRVESATDTIVIGLMLGPAMVPLYSIPQNLVRHIQNLGWSLCHVFMPLFSDLAARSELEKIRSIFLVGSKLVAGLVFALGLGAVLVGTPFLALWVGPDFTEQSDIILLLLVIFLVIPMINPFSSRYLTAIGKHGIYAQIMPVAALANLGLSVLLAGPLGIVGVALGSVVPAIIVYPILLVYTCKQLDLGVWTYLTKSLFPLIVPLCIMAAPVAWIRWDVGIQSYGMLIGAVTAGGVVYLIAFWALAFTREERAFVLDRLPGKKRG
ncbi:MAG: oligosaccharide flippase family protein [Thiohalomonadales bacterium]|nr:oligosaccharide flippase family protein [Thiohalomonadales bacterium]